MPLSAAEMQAARSHFCRRESEYLREVRAMKTKGLRTAAGEERCLAEEYETVKVLGKGSFGVVRLVRDRQRREVYAMKVIRKSKMLSISQEARSRAERDILVASEGSRW